MFFESFMSLLLIMIPAYFLAMRIEGQALQQTMLLQNIVGAQAVYMINCRELVDASLNKRMLKNKSIVHFFRNPFSSYRQRSFIFPSCNT